MINGGTLVTGNCVYISVPVYEMTKPKSRRNNVNKMDVKSSEQSPVGGVSDILHQVNKTIFEPGMAEAQMSYSTSVPPPPQ